MCIIPFGFPVEPDVYSRKRGSSPFIASGGANGLRRRWWMGARQKNCAELR